MDHNFFNRLMYSLYVIKHTVSEDIMEFATAMPMNDSSAIFYEKWLECYELQLMDDKFQITMKGIDFIDDATTRNIVIASRKF